MESIKSEICSQEPRSDVGGVLVPKLLPYGICAVISIAGKRRIPIRTPQLALLLSYTYLMLLAACMW
jgi:hypothetical protein